MRSAIKRATDSKTLSDFCVDAALAGAGVALMLVPGVGQGLSVALFLGFAITDIAYRDKVLGLVNIIQEYESVPRTLLTAWTKGVQHER